MKSTRLEVRYRVIGENYEGSRRAYQTALQDTQLALGQSSHGASTALLYPFFPEVYDIVHQDQYPFFNQAVLHIQGKLDLPTKAYPYPPLGLDIPSSLTAIDLEPKVSC